MTCAKTAIWALAILCLQSCAFPVRTGYDRNRGAYKVNPQSKPKTVLAAKSESHAQSAKPVATSNAVSNTAGNAGTLVPLERAIVPWIGVPHRIGGQDKNGTDCSGFCQIILRETQGVEVPRSTRDAWKTGTPVSRASLQPGDVVYFGNAWGVNHSGIWLGGGKFVHASTSRGVMITILEEDPYWNKRYRGARRYQ